MLVTSLTLAGASCDRAGSIAPTVPSAPTSTQAASVDDVVIDVLARQLGLPKAGITLASTFADLKMDELDVVEVVMELEDRLTISIPDDPFVEVEHPEKMLPLTVGDLCRIVRECQLHPSTRPRPVAKPRPKPLPTPE